jgi:hypothetical protein
MFNRIGNANIFMLYCIDMCASIISLPTNGVTNDYRARLESEKISEQVPEHRARWSSYDHATKDSADA